MSVRHLPARETFQAVSRDAESPCPLMIMFKREDSVTEQCLSVIYIPPYTHVNGLDMGCGLSAFFDLFTRFPVCSKPW